MAQSTTPSLGTTSRTNWFWWLRDGEAVTDAKLELVAPRRAARGREGGPPPFNDFLRAVLLCSGAHAPHALIRDPRAGIHICTTLANHLAHHRDRMLVYIIWTRTMCAGLQPHAAVSRQTTMDSVSCRLGALEPYH